jgi:hypothetical protein
MTDSSTDNRDQYFAGIYTQGINTWEAKMNTTDYRIKPIGQKYSTVFESPDPKTVYCYSPGIAVLPGGRLIATLDLGGGGVDSLDGIKANKRIAEFRFQGKIFTSDDKGLTWTFRTNYPGLHARPFFAGNNVYVLGHDDDLMILKSADLGETWSSPVQLTSGQVWHQAPSNVHYANGCVYLVMERRITHDITYWRVGELAPVLMRGKTNDDLTDLKNWTFAGELSFRNLIPNVETDPEIDYFGVPFFPCPYPRGSVIAGRRKCAPMGWLESNVVQFTDNTHYWHDPSDRTFHLWMRAHTGGTGYACMAKVVEKGETAGTGEMETMLETVPSGKKILYVPCPGGHNKFHVVYDDKSRLFWLTSVQSRDSMCRVECLPPERYDLPNNERRRLQLHFSRNMIDWCFAGLVAEGEIEAASRHYASMVIDGDDLCILSRSGDKNARDPHNGNLITFHKIPEFRELIY